MSVIVTLKFLHYLGLFFAGGLGIAGGVIQSAHKRAAMPPAPPVQRAMRILAILSLVAVILLWVTGIGLSYLVYGWAGYGWAFQMKLVGASILLLVIGGMNWHLFRAARAGVPPDAQLMKWVPSVSRGALVLVLAGIAITTTSG